MGLVVGSLVISACAAPSRIVVGAGTTVVDSGLMAALEAQFGNELAVLGGSTAEVLRLADQGSTSVAIVHDEVQEAAFVAAHPEVERRPVFSSRFLLVGPPDLVAQITADTTPAAAFAEIASNWVFISRDDRSGTHARELAIWHDAAIEPGGSWYTTTGQGMGFTLQVADQRRAFTLVEEGAFLAARDTLTLGVVALADDAGMVNPYSAVLIDETGRDFFEWLTGPAGWAAVVEANTQVFGRVVYAPSGDGE